MGRSTQETLDAFWTASGNADMPGIIAAYADDAILLTGGRAYTGKDAIQTLFEGWYAAASEETLVTDGRVIEGNIAMTEWHSQNDAGKKIESGVDTYVVQNGKIRWQTIWVMRWEEQGD